ncbi:MAG: AraC family transcriptional regulator [Planctomycetes bacterium]|nr:AraC family transcriptional regulator [Planctomycetota bacterium]
MSAVPRASADKTFPIPATDLSWLDLVSGVQGGDASELLSDLSLDSVSQVLDALRPFVVVPARPVLKAPWGVRVPCGHGGFLAVEEGTCVLTVHGRHEISLNLAAGDTAVVLRGDSCTIRDDAGTPAVAVEDLLVQGTGPAEAEGWGQGSGPSTVLMNGMFLFPVGGPPAFFESLPDVIHVANESGRPPKWIEPILQLLADELADPTAGSAVVRSRLAGTMLIQVIRHHVAGSLSEKSTSVAVLRDPRLTRVLHLMQVRLDHPWSVESLAKEANMSRSAFSARFNQLVGVSPMAHLFAIRMERAREMLQSTDHGLRWIAEQVGYGSEAAFSCAYRRWAGVAPGADRRR